ncbi:btk-binding protein-related [Anaeramoeba flamelloides]|uniref:Btk-binding protein-related n=1 Tax=Anaeramoeba flamelloides TaxID=1746091 RepID=A0ABQ8ZBV9_9EUKA|nr:btk-binding protein-related [Anaeramoeba flamelloides]
MFGTYRRPKKKIDKYTTPNFRLIHKFHSGSMRPKRWKHKTNNSVELLNGMVDIASTKYDQLVQIENKTLKVMNHNRAQYKNHAILNEELGSVLKICSGHSHFLILCESGKVYALGQNNSYCYGVGSRKLNVVKPILVRSLETQFIIDIECCSFNSFFVNEDLQLYSCGKGCSNGISERSIKIPSLVDLENSIEMIFAGSGSNHFFVTLFGRKKKKSVQSNQIKDELQGSNLIRIKNRKLLSCGLNESGQLGLGFSSQKEITIPIECQLSPYSGNDIQAIHCGKSHSIMMTTNGKLLGCGCKNHNGTGKDQTRFTEITALSEFLIEKLSVNNMHSVAITKENEIYYWGSGLKFTAQRLPTKLLLNDFQQLDILNVHCGFDFILIYKTVFCKTLAKDLKIYFLNNNIIERSNGKIESNEKGKEQDENDDELTILNWKINSQLLAVRGIPFERQNSFVVKLLDLYHNFKIKSEEIYSWIIWLYTNEYNHITLDHINKISQAIDLNDWKSRDLSNDLEKLFVDNSLYRADFEIKVNDNTTKNNKNKKQVHSFKVHKFLLKARSELFNIYTQNIDNSINCLVDNSGLSKNGLQFFLHFLYTDSLPKKEFFFQKSLIQELYNASEFYQLNVNSSLIYQIEVLTRMSSVSQSYWLKLNDNDLNEKK